MLRALPSQPNLEIIKKQARDLLHGLGHWDPDALRRYYSIDPDAETTLKPGLGDAQYVIAREYGFRSWRQLKVALDAKLER